MTSRSVTVKAHTKVAEDGDIGFIYLSLALVEIGTGNTSYINTSATVGLDLALKDGIDVLFWHFDLPEQLDFPMGRFLILLGLWALAVIVLITLILDGVFRFMVRKTKTMVDDIVLQIIRGPAIVIAIGYGIIDTLDVLDIPRDWLDIFRKVFFIIAICAGSYIVYKVLKDVLVHYGNMHAKRTGSESAKMIIPLINNIVSVIIVIVTASMLASYMGYDITVAVAGLGIMGLVIAFAAQDTLSNFFSGIHLLVDRPFSPGDLVILESGELCEIRDVGFRSARLYDVMEHVLITLPNNRLANSKIVNITAPDFNYRLKVPVFVAYGSDVDLVKRILLGIANDYPDVLKEERFKPTVRFKTFGDSSLLFDLYVWIEDVRKDNFRMKHRVGSDLNELIDQEFRKHGVKIPFPQREVWISSMATPPGPSK
jgi:small-conductance mechanosensitive channel